MKKVLVLLVIFLSTQIYAQKKTYFHGKDTTFENANGFLEMTIQLFQKDSAYMGVSGREFIKRTIYYSTETVCPLPEKIKDLPSEDCKKLFTENGIKISGVNFRLNKWLLKENDQYFVFDPVNKKVIIKKETDIGFTIFINILLVFCLIFVFAIPFNLKLFSYKKKS